MDTLLFWTTWSSAFLVLAPHFTGAHLQLEINFWKLYVFIQTSYSLAGCKVENSKYKLFLCINIDII